MAEMEASGIRCERFSLEESGLRMADRNMVRVIEITKLVEEKRGGGVSVPVDAFEGNNLILVDEGHKGSGGEAWRRFRDALGADGFHLRVQRHVRPGTDGRTRRRVDGRIRQGHRLRLFLQVLPRRRLWEGLPDPQPSGGAGRRTDGNAASGQPAEFLRAAALLPRAGGPHPALQPGQAAVGLRGQQRECGLHREAGEAV